MSVKRATVRQTNHVQYSWDVICISLYNSVKYHKTTIELCSSGNQNDQNVVKFNKPFDSNWIFTRNPTNLQKSFLFFFLEIYKKKMFIAGSLSFTTIKVYEIINGVI